MNVVEATHIRLLIGTSFTLLTHNHEFQMDPIMLRGASVLAVRLVVACNANAKVYCK